MAVAFLDGGGFVVLDTVTTPELEAEGLARDVVRAVQQARRDADLDVSDRIALTLRVPTTRPRTRSARHQRAHRGGDPGDERRRRRGHVGADEGHRRR